MSQYPPQYPVAYAPWPQSDPRGPAQRAGILMIILGVLGLLMAGCMGLVPLLKDMPEFQEGLRKSLKGQQIDTQTIVLGVIIIAVLLLVWSIAQIVLGVIVRRGTTVPVVISLVLSVVSLLVMLIGLVSSFVGGDIPGAACNVVLGALVALQLVWLVQAMKNAGQITAMQSQFQMWGYGQPMMPPMQPGYGYGYGQPQQQPPPAPPPPAAPPPSVPDARPPDEER